VEKGEAPKLEVEILEGHAKLSVRFAKAASETCK
jgi:hypothetical protein